MTEPRRPRTVVRDSSKGWDQSRPFLDVAISNHRCGFVNNGFIKTGPATTRLIDDIRRDSIANEVRRPAFTAVRSRFQTCGSVRRSMHHDDGRHPRFFARRDLELHIHLTDRDLVRSDPLVGSVGWRNGRIAGYLRNPTDKETALIFDDERFR